MANELVSIVMPVFNPDLIYLRAALRSIEIQQYEPIEIIISVDGGNLDKNTETLLEEFQINLKGSYIFNIGMPGIFGNLNNAITNANGHYIQIFCQDDVMSDTFIKNQVSDIEQDESIGVVFTAFNVIDERGKYFKDSVLPSFSPQKNVMIRKEDSVYYFLKYGCMPGNLSPIMIRKEVFSKVGLFNQQYPFAGDFEFLIRASQEFNLFYNHNQTLSIRRHYAQASYTMSNHQLLKDLSKIYKKLIEFLPEQAKVKSVRQINFKVGSLFVHHTVKNMFLGRLKSRIFYSQLKDLNEYPMNVWYSIYYYLLSIPGRVIRRL